MSSGVCTPNGSSPLSNHCGYGTGRVNQVRPRVKAGSGAGGARAGQGATPTTAFATGQPDRRRTADIGWGRFQYHLESFGAIELLTTFARLESTTPKTGVATRQVRSKTGWLSPCRAPDPWSTFGWQRWVIWGKRRRTDRLVRFAFINNQTKNAQGPCGSLAR
jgi:hypothetical protein